MARSLGRKLPQWLVERLAQRDLGARLGVALPFVTVDGDGRPHPMLLSYLEVRAYDSGTLGLVVQSRSASGRNLRERGVGTLLILEPQAIVYIKTRTVDGPLDVAGAEALGYFLLAVDEVLEDAAAEWEGAMRVTRGVTYAPPPPLDAPWAQATLAALATPRARA
jgi:hypothetical protein